MAQQDVLIQVKVTTDLEARHVQKAFQSARACEYFKKD
jgi:hypothetical protein